MPANLIINADDFGMSAGINRAIDELARRVAISSATLMAGGRRFHDAVEIAKAQPSLGVGCHLVFVDGTPLSPVQRIPTLLARDGGNFRSSLLEFAQAAMLGRIHADDVELETVAQIKRLQEAGLAVTHVDTHKHTHVFSAVVRGVLRGAARCGVRRYRFPFEPRWSRELSKPAIAMTRRVQMWGMQRLERPFAKAACAEGGGVTTNGTLGISATGSLTRDLLLTLCAHADELEAQPVLELCVHPGRVDDELRRTNTRLLESREIEYQALLELATLRPGMRMMHYGQLE